VTVQASAARKLIGRNPGFAEEALEAIETTSRRAVEDLDHLLDYVNAIRTVYEGESLLFPAAIRRLVARRGGQGGGGLAKANLTDREEEVLRLVAQGLSNAEIATELVLGLET